MKVKGEYQHRQSSKTQWENENCALNNHKNHQKSYSLINKFIDQILHVSNIEYSFFPISHNQPSLPSLFLQQHKSPHKSFSLLILIFLLMFSYSLLLPGSKTELWESGARLNSTTSQEIMNADKKTKRRKNLLLRQVYAEIESRESERGTRGKWGNKSRLVYLWTEYHFCFRFLLHHGKW